MNTRFFRTCTAAALGAAVLSLGASGLATATPPRPDPWVQGQIDSITENVPGYLSAINRSGIDRGGINDRDLVVKGHRICDQAYSARGDLGSARLPHIRKDDFHAMEVVAGASVKYLCPPAAPFVSRGVLDAAP